MEDAAPIHKSRSGETCPKLVDSFFSGPLDFRMGGQSQIVIGPEHNNLFAIEYDFWPLILGDRVIIGIKLKGMKLFDQLEKVMGLGKDIATALLFDQVTRIECFIPIHGIFL